MKLCHAILVLVLAAAAIVQGGCGGSGSHNSSAGVNLTNNTPLFAHVFIVVEENHSFNDVIGNTNMPYLNSLVSANGLATQYYADAHPSLPNYFVLTTGEGTSITGAEGDLFSGMVTQDNVVRALTAAGKTWKCYAESLPSPGYLGIDMGNYVRRHDPFTYFSDVQSSSSQASNIVDFTQLAADISNNALPDYAFIVPDVTNDAHNCPPGMTACSDEQKLANADQWLASNIQPLLASSAFQNSLLVITFDEGDATDIAHGGRQVATVIVSSLAKPGFKSTTFYQHESTLRLMVEGLGVPDLPGGASSAPDMGEFFK